MNAIEDYKGQRTSLKTLRTKEKKEVNFVLVIENKPVSMLEIKLSDAEISPTLPISINDMEFLPYNW